jgi:DNA-binding protein HU-beta
VNKNDLIDALAPRLGGRAAAALAVESFVDVVLRQVAAGGSVGVTGFGTFEPVERAPRTGRNPHTGQAVPIPATRTPRFRPGTYFRSVVADPAELPAAGLAGARVGSAEEAPRGGSHAGRHEVGRAGPEGSSTSPAVPGAPATIRRPAEAQERFRRTEPEPREGSGPTAARRRRTGTPATVRADRPATAPSPAAEPTGDDASGGRLTIGGEQITRDMITAKKAQLARAQNDQVTAEDQAGARDGRAGAAGPGKDRTEKPGRKVKKGDKDGKGNKDKKGKREKKDKKDRTATAKGGGTKRHRS